MQRAILFWCYRDAALCRSRLRLLRHFGPDTPIYVLFGGRRQEAEAFAQELAPLADDFWAFEEQRQPRWRWRNGNLLLREWHLERGKDLPWDTIVVAQWDLLALRAVDDLFATLRADELLIPGLRPVAEVEGWWPWVRRDRPRLRARYEAFVETVRRRHGAAADAHLLCGLFVLACLPRSFLEAYGRYATPEEGFLEYAIPTLARLWGHAFCTDHPYRPWWSADPATRSALARERILRAADGPVARRTILAELLRPGGGRLFHPYHRPVAPRLPRGAPPWALFLAGGA